MVKINKEQYSVLVKKHSPKSKKLKDLLCAFTVGGSICTLGQLLYLAYSHAGAESDVAYGAVSVTLIFLTAVLTGLGVFDKIAKVGGAGTLVPITGFANAVVSPAVEFRAEGLIYGVGVKAFSIAGPVIVFGVSSAIVIELIKMLLKLLGVNI